MTATEAKKLRTGDRIRHKPTGKVLTVEGLDYGPIGDSSRNVYIVITKEMGAVSHLNVRHEYRPNQEA